MNKNTIHGINEILSELARLSVREDELNSRLDKQRSLLTIKCVSCGKNHAIADLTAIQTHWYTEPNGCTGGDYWNTGEIQFICPKTEVRNRLSFDNYDVPWDERREYKNNPSDQFNRIYKSLFKDVIKEYEKNHQHDWVNNEFVDKNRAMFGLVERRTKP